MLKNIWNDESGQGMVEYGLILALVSIVAIASLTTLGDQISEKFTKVTDAITGEVGEGAGD